MSEQNVSMEMIEETMRRVVRSELAIALRPGRSSGSRRPVYGVPPVDARPAPQSSSVRVR